MCYKKKKQRKRGEGESFKWYMVNFLFNIFYKPTFLVYYFTATTIKVSFTLKSQYNRNYLNNSIDNTI